MIVNYFKSITEKYKKEINIKLLDSEEKTKMSKFNIENLIDQLKKDKISKSDVLNAMNELQFQSQSSNPPSIQQQSLISELCK
jgi:hypothetical protein